MPTAENQLVAGLPRGDRIRLKALCEPVHLQPEQVLGEPGHATSHVYFPIDSFISLIARVDPLHGLEVGIAGREGMLGAHLALGVSREPLQLLVRGSGSAWRIAAAPFREELVRSPALAVCVHRYLYVAMLQRATLAACLRFHEIGPRLARWLLMSQDRAHANQFAATQEFVAMMLGVRRVGVTAAAGVLQKRGLIEYHRGEMKIVDRAGLEAASCTCYKSDLAASAVTMGSKLQGGEPTVPGAVADAADAAAAAEGSDG